MKTCPHSVHSFRAVRSLLIVEESRSVKAAAETGKDPQHEFTNSQRSRIYDLVYKEEKKISVNKTENLQMITVYNKTSYISKFMDKMTEL